MEELMGTDLLFEKVRPGTGDMAEVGVIVKCNYRGYFYSMEEKRKTAEEPFEEYRDQCFQIGEGDCIPGLELALRQSHTGEIFKVYIASKFGFGFNGRCAKADGAASKVAAVPPDADLMYEVEVTKHLVDGELDESLQKKCENDLSKANDEDEKSQILRRYSTLQAMQLRKEAGNRWFSYQDFLRAGKAYSRATQFAEGYFNPDKNKKSLGESVEDAAKSLEEQHQHEQKAIDDEDRDLVEVYIACLNNLAACKISLKDYSAAKDLCVQVLQLSPWNGKALLRAAKATLAMDAYDECEACLKKLISIENIEDSLKTAAKLEYQKLKKAISDYKNHTKEMQKRIVNKLFNADAEKNAKKDGEKKADAVDASPTPQSQPLAEQSTASNTPEVAPAIADTKTNSDKPPLAATAATAVAEAVPKAQTASNNLIILLATSLVVVLLSIVFAVYSH